MEPDLARRARLKLYLTRDEEAYLSDVQFETRDLTDEERRRSLAAASALASSLIARGGLPKVRWRYFTDPELNFDAGKSRMEMFQAEGPHGPAILAHPCFLPMLHYWIYGPDLPPAVINWFFVAAAQHTDKRMLRRAIRQAVRDHDLAPERACEEFFKLALEAGLDIETAWSIRTAVHTLRRPGQSRARPCNAAQA